MTNSRKTHPCRKVSLGALDKRIARALASMEEELIDLCELQRRLDQDGHQKIQSAQLQRRLKSLAREDFVRLHNTKSKQYKVGKGQFFVNFVGED